MRLVVKRAMAWRTQLVIGITIAALVIVAGSIALLNRQANAAPVSNFSFSTTSSAASDTATYTFKYTTVNTSNIVWRLYGWTGVDFSHSTAVVKINGTQHIIPNTGSGYYNGGAPYIRVPGVPVIPAGAEIEVVISGVINPSTPGTYTSSNLGTANGGGGIIDNVSPLPSIVVTSVAPLSFSTPTTKEVITDEAVAINDLQIVGGTGNPIYNVNLYVEGGSLAFGSSEHLTFNGATTGQQLQFSGTKVNINKALTTLLFTAPSGVGELKLEALINDESGGVIWSSNEHAYKVVTAEGAGISWDDAKTAAEAQTFGGVPGYLATIASADEHNFILSRINQDGWIGASDAAVEGEWRWMTGPEAGQQFWQGAGAGTTTNGLFANWNQVGGATEPNNSGAGEDCAQIRFTASAEGRWNDLPCSTLLPNYVVEFGAPGALPTVVTTEFTINVKPETFTATFNTMGGTAVPAMTEIEAFEYITLPAAPQRAGYIFTAWSHMSESIDDYEAGAEFQMYIVDAYFEAQWVEDGNIDVIPDSEQDNVVNLTNPATGVRTTLELDPSCDIVEATLQKQSDLAVQDSTYSYESGFVNFTATGCDNDTTTVKLYYYGLSSDEVVVRKHNPSKSSFFTIDEALLTKQTIANQNVVIVSYEVTDGGSLDVDGVKNGTIVDPVGLGRIVTAVPSAPNTGVQTSGSQLNITLVVMAAISLFVGLMVLGVTATARR